MLKRNWALIGIVYLALAEVLSWAPVPNLTLCLIQSEDSQQSTNNDEKKYCPAFHSGAALAFERLDSFLEHHDKSVVGGFTIVLAISTIGLWLATNKLWEAGEKQFKLLSESAVAQSRDMQASIVAAQRSADAATLAIGSERAWFTAEQIPIGEAANGKIGERNFDRAVFARVFWKNTGRSPSLSTALYITCKVVPFYDETIPVFVADWETGGTLPVGPGALATSGPAPLVDAERDALFEKRVALVVYSSIRYSDVFSPGITRVSEVCYKIRFDGSVTDTATGKTGHNWMIQPFGPQNTAT